MGDTVRIPVAVDTRKARADLDQLHEDKGRAEQRVRSAARRTSRVAVRAFAFTGAVSAIGNFQSQEPSGNVSVFEEALTPFIAAGQQFADRELGFSGRAYRTAREQTKAAFAYHVGRTGETAGVRDFFDTVHGIQEDVESGRNLIRQDPRFLGPDLETATKAALKGNMAVFWKNFMAARGTGALTRAFDYVVEGITAD